MSSWFSQQSEESKLNDIAKQKLNEIVQEYQKIQDLKSEYDLAYKRNMLNFDNNLKDLKDIKDLKDLKDPKDLTDKKVIENTNNFSQDAPKDSYKFKRGDFVACVINSKVDLAQYIGQDLSQTQESQEKFHCVMDLKCNMHYITSYNLESGKKVKLNISFFVPISIFDQIFKIQCQVFEFQQKYLKIAQQLLNYASKCLQTNDTIYYTIGDDSPQMVAEYKIKDLVQHALTFTAWIASATEQKTKFEVPKDVVAKFYLATKKWLLFPKFSQIFKDETLDDKKIIRVLSLVLGQDRVIFV